MASAIVPPPRGVVMVASAVTMKGSGIPLCVSGCSYRGDCSHFPAFRRTRPTRSKLGQVPLDAKSLFQPGWLMRCNMHVFFLVSSDTGSLDGWMHGPTVRLGHPAAGQPDKGT